MLTSAVASSPPRAAASASASAAASAAASASASASAAASAAASASACGVSGAAAQVEQTMTLDGLRSRWVMLSACWLGLGLG